MSYQFSNVMSRFLGDSHQSKSIKSSSIVSASDSAVKQVNEKLMAPIHFATVYANAEESVIHHEEINMISD